MELKEFISNALVDLVKAIEDAQKRTKDSAASISYSGSGHNVEFNVVLTEFESTDKGGGIGVAFGSIGIKGAAKSNDSNTSVTSMRFTIPVAYPKDQK